MRIAIFGSGGVGGYFGARLAQAGVEVNFIARGAHLAAMHKNGLKVDSIAGDFQLAQIQASDDPTSIGEVDYIFCSVKAWQVPEAAAAMQPMMGPQTLVIPLQNGVEAPDQLSSVLGTNQVLGGMCAIIAFQVGPGHIKHAGASPLIRFGHRDRHPDPRLDVLAQLLNDCEGVSASIAEDIEVAMWQKFMLICAWSGVGSISRAPIGVLLNQQGTRRLLQQAMDEIYHLALARKIDLPPDSVAKTLALLEKFPATSTTSMQRDLNDGSPSELDFQNGAVVRLAQQVGVETPLNCFIFDSLLALELRARGELEF